MEQGHRLHLFGHHNILAVASHGQFHCRKLAHKHIGSSTIYIPPQEVHSDICISKLNCNGKDYGYLVYRYTHAYGPGSAHCSDPKVS